MSRWLDLARHSDLNANSLPDTLQEPAKSPPDVRPPPFLQVSAGCRVKKSEQRGRSVAAAQSNVVSLDEWRSRPSLDGHQPDGGAA
jgi:hypothetical protein